MDGRFFGKGESAPNRLRLKPLAIPQLNLAALDSFHAVWPEDKVIRLCIDSLWAARRQINQDLEPASEFFGWVRHGNVGEIAGQPAEVGIFRLEQGQAADEGTEDKRKPGRITTHANRPLPQASPRIMPERLEGVNGRARGLARWCRETPLLPKLTAYLPHRLLAYRCMRRHVGEVPQGIAQVEENCFDGHAGLSISSKVTRREPEARPKILCASVPAHCGIYLLYRSCFLNLH
jgi:hypothetical protein